MKKPIYLKRYFSFFAALLCFGWTSWAQIVINPGFESPANAGSGSFFIATNAGTDAITPWTVGGRVDIHHHLHHSYGGADSQHADLNDTGWIMQTITGLTTGSTYTVSFLTRIHSRGGTNGAATSSATGLVTGTSGVLGFLNISHNIAWPISLAWNHLSFTFTADGPTATLSFTGTGSLNSSGGWAHGGVMLDNIQVLPPCTAGLVIDSLGCDEFLFSSFSSVHYDAEIWYLNGVVTDLTDGPILLPRGSNEICLSYLGSDSLLANTFCCDRICFTIDVEGIDTTYRSDSSCALGTGILIYEPCEVGNYSFYSIDDILPNITPCSGAGTHNLAPGNYTIRHYDEDSCLRWVEYLNYFLITPDTTTCYKRVVKCLFPVDPVLVLPTAPYCLDCYDQNRSADFVVEAPMLVNVNGATETYERRILDLVNCTVCVFTFDIVDSVCNFSPDFTINPLGGNSYQFNQVAPTLNFCGNVTWTITDMTGGGTPQVFTQAPFAPLNYGFPGPGTYQVTLDVCVCVCNDTCCKSVTYEVVIPSPLGVIQDPSKGEQHGSKETGGVNNPQENDKVPNTGETLPTLPVNGTGIRLVPNPTSSEFKIVIDGIDASVYDLVQIIAADGKIVETFRSIAADNLYQLQVAPGAYMVKVLVHQRNFDTKLIIQ